MKYYVALQVAKACYEVDVKKAFRELGLRWHPKKNPSRRQLAQQKFNEICEAYEVLGDSHRKSAYERYGVYIFA